MSQIQKESCDTTSNDDENINNNSMNSNNNNINNNNNNNNDNNDNKTNGVSLQLELLANTNVLTIRIKWVINPHDNDNNNNNENNDNDDNKDKRVDTVINELTLLLTENKGCIINPTYIESFEFLPDDKRHYLIKNNNYTFESACIDYKKSYNDEDETETKETKDMKPLYQTVLQCQFQNKLQLDSLLDDVTGILERYNDEDNTNTGVIDKWSISFNNHALKHPGNIFIGNINPDVTLQELNELCEDFGPILSIKLINNNNNSNSSNNKSNTTSNQRKKNKEEQIPKNFGFVSFQLGSQASNCINTLNGKIIKGSSLLVNYHVERKERERLYWNQFKYNDSNMGHTNTGFHGNPDVLSNNDEFNDLDEDDFKCVFIGNLPKRKPRDYQNDEQGEQRNPDSKSDVITTNIITGDEVVTMVNDILKKQVPDFEILSYYFPLENHEDQLKGDNQSLLKGYGFIKVNTHEEALICIDSLNLTEWYGNKLIVNRAIQNRINYSNTHATRNNNNSGNISSRTNSATNMNNNFRKPFSRSSSYVDFVPPQYLNVSPYSKSMVPTSSVSSLSTTSSFLKQNPSDITTEGPHYEEHIEENNAMQSPIMFSPPPPVPVPNFISPPISLAPMSVPLNNPYAATTIPRNLPIPLDSQQESNLYVKHLPLNWNDEDLYQYYSTFGKIISSKIITVGGSTKKDNTGDENGDIGSSKGYGFVCFENPLDASRAIMSTDGVRLDMNHVLEVSFANKKNINGHKNNNIHHNYNEPRYNPKFLSALMHEQNSQFMYNPAQGFSSMASASTHPSMLLPPQQTNVSPTTYNYPTTAANPIPTFVPVSAYRPINVPFPNHH